MMHNADIIIFNKAVGTDRREIFLPTIIHDVCWYGSRMLDTSGATDASFKVRIPYIAGVEGRKTYVPEQEYRQASFASKKHSWTLQKNCFVMVFQKGVIESQVEFSSEDVMNLGKRFDEFFTVTEYADNTFRGTPRTKHWRVGGR